MFKLNCKLQRKKYFAVAENSNGVKDSAKHWLKYFRESHILNKPKCRDCWAKFFCSGGCHANADLFNNDIRKPYDVGCEIQKKRLECAIYVQTKLQTAT